jgi:hypothetical protein
MKQKSSSSLSMVLFEEIARHEDNNKARCSGQVISDTTIGFVAVLFRSKTEGNRLPNTECIRLQL